MSVFADMSQEMVLVQRLAELQERLKHAEMLNHQRWEDVLSLQRDLGNRNGTGEGTLLDLQLPAIYNFLPHLANGPDAIRPALKVSKGRTGATMVLGIPTVKREVQSYLMGTLHNLIANMNPNERETSLIVVLIAELEDDILSKPGYISKMRESAYKQVSLKRHWLILDFCQLGFIGKRSIYFCKMFKCVDLSKFVAFFLIFYNDKPVDWLLDNMMITTVCRSDKDQKDCRKRIENVWIHYKPSLFQHVGMHSSLKGKVQKLKDHQFGKLAMFVAHQNPEARVSTTLKSYRTFTITRAYKGISYFWSLGPQKGDNITFQFTPPVQIESGNPEHPKDRFFNTTVEVRLDYEPLLLSAFPRTADGFYVVGSFKESNGVAERVLPADLGAVSVLRLNVQSDSDHWAILSEIWIKVFKNGQNDTNLSLKPVR
ncbi:N-acetylglucosaminyltransferase VI, putative [Ixodes scapularis]|uniref:N-acetylglucosaminyltransferase VI, putative n=1 Tax=Ixodes scapularis TaxID=6945 RepID=B7QKW4_IXOSC|nr:N-acetylglucosaminyltransferase VI, putative [Ixodes scapularis]|eukprot:XP_002415819.1 N-acetylglucosaminyltransferase VI, putative [Ixodes scapularis]